MDLQRLKQLSEAKIKAGTITKQVRDTLKEYKHDKQDLQQGLSETFKPIIKAQEETKQTIDEKQDKLIEQLEKNQKALTSGLEDIAMLTYQPETKPPEAKLPIGYKPLMMSPDVESNLDAGFDIDEIQKLMQYDLAPPSSVLQASMQGDIDIKDYDANISKMLKKLGTKKGPLSKGQGKTKNKDKIDKIDEDIKLLQKYRGRIKIIPEGMKTIKKGSGYTQPKRNAYKISSSGKYGGLMIDIPKLMGQLRLVATKDKRKVMDKKVDFDTIDLLTKRFNSKKKYSDIAKMVFDELNQLSEIPIHKSSKKFKKLGSGVVYFNDANDLIDRMELLGGSILAGNNGVKEEFSQIAHKLNQLGLINNKQLIDLLQQYIIK